MKRKPLLYLFFLFFIFYLPLRAQQEWEIKKSTHFIIHYQKSIPSHYITTIARKAEKYYNTITKELGFRRFNFWTWNKRCKIYLYSSREVYYNNTQIPSWSQARVEVKERIIYGFLEKKDFVRFIEEILPHEMGHLIFREFVGYETKLPLWLDEGIACFVEKRNKQKRLNLAKKIVNTDAFISLEKLTSTSKNSLDDPDVFYAESASIIDFLLEKYGRDKFVEYCRSLRDGNHWKESLLRVYDFSEFSQIGDEWVKYLLLSK